MNNELLKNELNQLNSTEYTHEKVGTAAAIQINEYNGDGQRIRKTEGADTINYYYQGSTVLYTESGQNQTTALNLLGTSGNTIATARTNATSEDYYFYHDDTRGSTTNLISETGESVVSYDYTDFGETTVGGNQEFYNEIAYTGGIYDKTTGLYYLNARYYNPDDARFITQDTYRGDNNDSGSLHLYAYCVNNPVNFVDPSGHAKTKVKKLRQKAKLWPYMLLGTLSWELCTVKYKYEGSGNNKKIKKITSRLEGITLCTWHQEDYTTKIADNKKSATIKVYGYWLVGVSFGGLPYGANGSQTWKFKLKA